MKNLLRKEYLPYHIVAVLLVALLIIGGIYDLDISKSVYSGPNPFNIFFESFGWIVGYSFVPLLSITFFFNRNPNSKVRYFLIGFGFVISLLGYTLTMANGIEYLFERNVINEVNDKLFGFILALAMTALTYFIGYKLKPFYNKIIVLTYVVLSLFIIYALFVEGVFKPLIARTRYDDMLEAGSLNDFTRWFVRGNGGSSFPSGHTALSGVILFICCLPDIIKTKINRKWLYLIGLVYIALMAFARIQIGRHFLSDTVAATIIMSLGIMFILRSKTYKRLVSELITK